MPKAGYSQLQGVSMPNKVETNSTHASKFFLLFILFFLMLVTIQLEGILTKGYNLFGDIYIELDPVLVEPFYYPCVNSLYKEKQINTTKFNPYTILTNQTSVLLEEKQDSFLESGGIMPLMKNKVKQFHCKLGLIKFCESMTPSDSVDLILAINTVNTQDQAAQENYYYLLQYFNDYCRAFGISVMLYETVWTQKNQTFKITSPGKEPYENQLKSDYFFYNRENLINAGVRKWEKYGLEWEYVIWVDSHQYFFNTYWWFEYILKNSHHKTVQLFTKGYWMDAKNHTTPQRYGAKGALYMILKGNAPPHGEVFGPANRIVYKGQAWGISRDVLKKIEKIPDMCVVGACDCLWINACVKKGQDKGHPTPYGADIKGYYDNFREDLDLYQKVIDGDGAIIRGSFIHLNHTSLINWGFMYKFANKKYNLSEVLGRDDDYVIYVKDPSIFDDWIK